MRDIFGDPKARVIGLNRRSKNGMRLLRSHAGGLVRSQDLPGARSVAGAIVTLVAMTLSQGHQPPRNSPTGSRSLSFWGRLRYRTYRHPLVMFGIGPPIFWEAEGGV